MESVDLPVLPPLELSMRRRIGSRSVDGWCTSWGWSILPDIAGLRQGLQLGLYVVITVLALLALRIVVQVTMLHEEHHNGCPDKPLLCAECEYVVPDMAFCAHCGVAANASSRCSRTTRRLARPVPIDPTAAGS
jgi:hypothetical protein